MKIEEYIRFQNIIASQSQWEGIFHCPVLVVNREKTKENKKTRVYFNRVAKGVKEYCIKGGKDGQI